MLLWVWGGQLAVSVQSVLDHSPGPTVLSKLAGLVTMQHWP